MGANNGKPIKTVGNVIGKETALKEVAKIVCSREKHLHEKLDSLWEDTGINVCLLGESGVGKSSFINNVMGQNVAEVGVFETTRDAITYPHPNNNKLILWDLPGYGCQLYESIDEYLSSIDMTRFDIILFFHKERFKVNDDTILKAILKIEKPYLVIRSHFDVDLQNMMSRHAKQIVLGALRSSQLRYEGKCYFVCNDSKEFDFQELVEDLFAMFCEIDVRFQQCFDRLIPDEPIVGHADNLNEMKKMMRNESVKNATSKIREKLLTWKHVPLNVCLVGESGAGKSSFINNMSGRKIASVGIVGTTQRLSSYPHPVDNKLKFWDTPGYGCKLYPNVLSYIEAMDVKRFDIIIFLFSCPFNNEDAHIVKEIKKIGKPFFLMRSKFDLDVKHKDIEEVKKTIQNDVVRALGRSEVRCYFISNLSHDHDYDSLMREVLTLVHKSTEEKEIIFSIKNSNDMILEIKKEELKRFNWIMSAVSGLVTPRVPFGLPYGRDIALNMIISITTCFRMATFLDILEDLETRRWRYLENCGIYFSVNCMNGLLRLLYPSPMILGFVSLTTFAMTKYTLDKVLNDLVQAATLKLHNETEQFPQLANEDHNVLSDQGGLSNLGGLSNHDELSISGGDF